VCEINPYFIVKNSCVISAICYINFNCSRKDFSMSYSETSGENQETKCDSVLGLLIMMGRVDMLITLISGIVFFLGGCVKLVGVSFPDSAFFCY
jgi:hypothetical protein